MITITLDDATMEMSAKGHAEPEETEDFEAVCTAVSAIAQGLGYSLAKYQSEKDALKGMDYTREKGDVLIRAYPEEWARAGTRRKIQTYGDGLELLAMTHPESVTMYWNGRKIETMMTKEEGEA